MQDSFEEGEGTDPPPQVTVSTVLDLDVGVIMLATDGRVRLWSPTAERILGWCADQAIDEPFATLLGDQRPEDDLFAPGPDGTAFTLHRRLLDHPVERQVVDVRHRDGHLVRTELGAYLLTERDGTQFILLNLVERDRLRGVEHDLAALDALYSSSPLGVAILDTDQRYVRVNQALAALHESTPEELVGRSLQDLLPQWIADELGTLQQQVLETGRPVIDRVFPASRGRGYRSVSYSRLTDHHGRVLGLSTTVQDVTERREALEKTERGRQRLKLLDDVGVALGDLLDVRRIAEALVSALVSRFADYGGVALRSSVVWRDEPSPQEFRHDPVTQVAVAAKDRGAAVNQMLAPGDEDSYVSGTVIGSVLETGTPRLITSREELEASVIPGGVRGQAALELGVHSLLVVPLSARGTPLGVLVLCRAEPREPFDEDDVALSTELASRAGISLENARLYAGEREAALMLQRSLLPQRVPSPPGVSVAYRYVPGSSGAEVGGDWFDVVSLAGGRVALVIGDVMGHGLHAAATMGRLRTAVRTLAGLDLAPHELLRRVNNLADDLVPGTEDPLWATCVYAVFDPATGRCVLSTAGHVPPLLLTPRQDGDHWDVSQLDLPTGAPLGVGGVTFESYELDVEPGSVLALYTDGLVESRHEDITEGIARLRSRFAQAERTPGLEEVCDRVIGSLGRPEDADDVALLMAQLGGVPEEAAVSWTFPAHAYVVRRARGAVRHTLRGWGLEAIMDETVLLVSELVTNSLRYARGPIGVRMVRGPSLLVEVSDPLLDPPREQHATEDDEGGRGMQLVSRQSHRWGTRYGPLGKTVWFELTLPG